MDEERGTRFMVFGECASRETHVLKTCESVVHEAARRWPFPKRFQSLPLQDTPEEIRDWKRNAFENGSASLRRHAEAQRFQLIQ